MCTMTLFSIENDSSDNGDDSVDNSHSHSDRNNNNNNNIALRSYEGVLIRFCFFILFSLRFVASRRVASSKRVCERVEH